MLKSIIQYFKRRSQISSAEKSLYALTERELNDIGISRSEIRRIAREI